MAATCATDTVNVGSCQVSREAGFHFSYRTVGENDERQSTTTHFFFFFYIFYLSFSLDLLLIKYVHR